MSHGFPESDWKVFRKLSELALERYCENVLRDIEKVRLDQQSSSHKQYIEIYRLIQKSDEEIADTFNDHRRSMIILQLSKINRLELLEPEELAMFSQKTQDTVASLSKAL